MSTGITDISINPDWLYHRVKEEDLDKIILSGGLKSAKKTGKKTKKCNFNGYDYIPLSKKMDLLEGTSSSDYSYEYYIDSHYAYVIEGVSAIKTRYVKEYNDFYGFFCKLPINIRVSHWLDEYQVKNEISLDKMKGIKIPNLKSDFVDLEYSEMLLEHLLEKMESVGGDFPFIDVEEKKMIEKGKIKEYIKGVI